MKFTNLEFPVIPELLLWTAFWKLYHISCYLFLCTPNTLTKKFTPVVRAAILLPISPPRMVGSVQTITPSTNLVKKVSSVRTSPNLSAVSTDSPQKSFFCCCRVGYFMLLTFDCFLIHQWQNHRITQVGKTSKIIQSNRQPTANISLLKHIPQYSIWYSSAFWYVQKSLYWILCLSQVTLQMLFSAFWCF